MKHAHLKNKLDIEVNLKEVEAYFIKEMLPNEYIPIVEILHEFHRKCIQPFRLKEAKDLQVNQWFVNPLTKEEKEFIAHKYKYSKKDVRFKNTKEQLVTMITLSSDIHPFKIQLDMKNEQGLPIILLKVFSQYQHNLKYQCEVILSKRIKKGTLREELIAYWENGKIIQELNKEKEASLVSFKEAIKLWTNKNLKDVNENSLNQTQQQFIVYLYAQLVNKSGGLLSSEPMNWDVPKTLINKLTSGLADALQDNNEQLIMSDEYKNSEHKKFMKNYPSVEKFAQIFDYNYLG